MSFHYIELERRYPAIFKNNVAVNCGPGWLSIIDALCENLQSISVQSNTQIEATQVMTKNGSLEFSFKPHSFDASLVVNLAQALSSSICDTCGKPGQLINSRTRCTEHRD